MKIIYYVSECCMDIGDVHIFFIIINWHYKGNVFDTKLIVFAEYINETFAHVSINTALYRVINGGHFPLYFEKNIEQPFGIGVEMLPLGDKHV